MKKKNTNLTAKAITIIGLAMLSMSFTACKKDNTHPSTGPDSVIHKVDARLVGKWMWTEHSDAASYDDNGVYNGSAYELAMEYSINADGSGTCFDHIYSSIGTGTGLEVNISYKGFFESDEQGHLGFFPTSGTYKSTSGENRALRADELWNTKTNTGNSFLYQKLVFTTQGQRTSFQVTSSDDVTDSFFNMQ